MTCRSIFLRIMRQRAGWARNAVERGDFARAAVCAANAAHYARLAHRDLA